MPQDSAGTILVVDDEDVIRDLIGTVLEEGGYRVLTATDGRGAVTLFREHVSEIDLILLDMQMPDLDGRQTLALLREVSPTVRVIMATGFAFQEVVEQVRKAGVLTVLHKPFHIEELLAAVGAALTPGS